ncbi:MAG: TonB family protein [Chitinivibrionia bacterium]|nr:TonB family protein [Chitinivibrionia bacterium]
MFQASIRETGRSILQVPLWISGLVHLALLTPLLWYEVPSSGIPGRETLWVRIESSDGPGGTPATRRRSPPAPPLEENLRVAESPGPAFESPPFGKLEETEKAEDVAVLAGISLASVEGSQWLRETGESPEETLPGIVPNESIREEGELIRFRAMIVERIGGKKVYPLLARKRGMEGDVHLWFRVRSDGKVGEIAANHKTGRLTLLEASAVDLVRSSAPFLPVPDFPDPNGVPVEMTISYRLEDSVMEERTR